MPSTESLTSTAGAVTGAAGALTKVHPGRTLYSPVYGFRVMVTPRGVTMATSTGAAVGQITLDQARDLSLVLLNAVT